MALTAFFVGKDTLTAFNRKNSGVNGVEPEKSCIKGVFLLV